MDLSLGGLLGAMVGSVLGAINYAVIVSFVVKWIRGHDAAQTPAEREALEAKIFVLRRLVLAAVIAVFAGIGYWFGHTMAG